MDAQPTFGAARDRLQAARRIRPLLAIVMLLPVTADADAPPGRVQAAVAAATTHPACRAITPFYWEIGDAHGRLAGGTEGGDGPTADTPMRIASASKWLFGAYVVQRRHGALTADDIDALTMRSGYTHLRYRLCTRRRAATQAGMTVAECFNARGLFVGSNARYSADEKGRFHYNGGHFQHWAVNNGLGAMNNVELADAMRAQLGTDLPIGFDSPQLAGGGYTTAATYSRFLRKLLAHRLLLGSQLGDDAVCTDSGTCPSEATYSPVPHGMGWRYSLGHWVEGDGTFSSPGAFGFYPWIDRAERRYGIVARESHRITGKVAMDSVECGVAIRRAWTESQ